MAEPLADDAEADVGRRRWPLVTSVLAVLVIVIVAGGYAAWRYTQTQYYVGSDGQQVAIFRGVDEQVAGLSLSSVAERTGIPVAHMTAADAQQIKSTITATSLADAKRIVVNIQHDYSCQVAVIAVQKWAAAKPKPAKPKKVKGKLVPVKPKPYPAKPPVPAYCAAQQGAA
jgi:protein phosphatase